MTVFGLDFSPDSKPGNNMTRENGYDGDNDEQFN